MRPTCCRQRPALFCLRFSFAFIVAAGLGAHEAKARTCEGLFKSTRSRQLSTNADNESIPTRTSVQYYEAHTAKSQLARLSKAQVETLFKIRDRILAGASKETYLSSPAEFLLVREILGREWKAEDSLSLQEWENRLAIPSFKYLAYKVAFARAKFDRATDFDDLFQAAMTGLFEGIRQYESDSIFMVSTYIYRHAKDAMNEVARTSSIGIDIASTSETYRKLSILLRTRDSLRVSLKRDPSNEEIMGAYNKTAVTPTTMIEVSNILGRYSIARAMRLSLLSDPRETQALDESTRREVDAIEFLEAESLTPAEAYDFKYTASRIAWAITTLTPREELIISMRFGLRPKVEDDVYSLEYSDPMSLSEVGERMHVTRERIRQLEAKLIRKLKHPSRELRDHLEFFD